MSIYESSHPMRQITINLTYHKYSTQLPEQFIKTILSCSLLDTTLELDPTTEVIDISSSKVYPKALDILKYMADTNNIPSMDHIFQNDKLIQELRQSADYLMCNILDVIVHEKYIVLSRMMSHVNLLNISQISESSIYQRVIGLAIQYNIPRLVEYMFRVVLPKIDIDPILMAIAMDKDNSYVVNLFFDRQTIPSFTCMINAVYRNNKDWINRILANPCSDLSHYRILELAVTGNDVDLVRRLIMDSRVNLSGRALDIALYEYERTLLDGRYPSLDIIKVLWSNPTMRKNYNPD